MIGSGIFLLPAALAPYGLLSFAGWILTAGGSIFLALVIARLSHRTSRSGGVYIYAQDAFGDLTGFLIAWGYWAAYWISIPAIAIAFVGYLGVFIPGLDDQPQHQAMYALALIWVLTFINMRSLKGAGYTQLLMTALKLIPLAIIIVLGATNGDGANLPETNPKDVSMLGGLATTALLTMWAFSGLEAGTVPAGDVDEPQKTIPKAILLGTLTVAFVYIASTYAVMRLVPAEVLVNSKSPFSDAAISLGQWGPHFIAAGALISTAGALNGVIFITGQMPMALAIDRMAPKVLATRNASNAPYISLILGSILGSLLLLMNYNKGLIGMFVFLAMMSTLAVLVPLLFSALADMRYSWKTSKPWIAIAMIAALYSVFAILGSGIEVIGWGLVLFAVGVPVYYWIRKTNLQAKTTDTL
ncbi:MAG: amino acid permease [Acidimicrobiales bacterium]|nr:MAG: amino acid permease [Acidimicrobiales bacterium]